MQKVSALRVRNLRLGIEESEQALPEVVARALGVRCQDIQRWRILRKSLDARDKDDLAFVYSVEVNVAEDVWRRLGAVPQVRQAVVIEPYVEPPFTMPEPGQEPLRHPPVIIGSGPAGLAAGYFLAQYGYRPIILERGKPVRERIQDIRRFDAGGPHDPESNYLFGEGGAGTFSDGKLTCRNTGPDVRRILELFAECKGKPSLVYEHRPHLGSNRLPAVVKAFRQRIERMGGTFRFQCRAEDLDIADGRVRGVCTSSGYIPAEVVILAIGHSARDTYAMLWRRGVPMVPKPFQFGVRIEQPQENVNRYQYGMPRLECKLGAADYTVVVHGHVDLYSFCMCAGGHVIPSVSEPEHFCTNGMSYSRRDSPFANSGLVVTLEPHHFGSDHPMAGVELQRRFERRAWELGQRNYYCPIQWAKDFLAKRPSRGRIPSSYRRGVVPADIAELVPPVILHALYRGLPVLDHRWHGLFLREATLVGPEARGSSPVRIVRDPSTRMCPGLEGLYPIGEGAGYAGGIVSAAVDGLRTARAIIARFAPLDKK
jgi:uncharacterized FAD-dependent dehydrogenase